MFPLYDHRTLFCTSPLPVPDWIFCIPRKIVGEMMKDINKYVVLKKKKKDYVA